MCGVGFNGGVIQEVTMLIGLVKISCGVRYSLCAHSFNIIAFLTEKYYQIYDKDTYML